MIHKYGIMNESPWTWAELLSLHNVTVTQFKNLQFRSKTGLVYALLLSLTDEATHWKLRRHKKDSGIMLEITRKEVSSSRLRNAVANIVETCKLYDTEGKVRTDIVGTFSFNDSEPSDNHELVECPNCSNEEVVVSGDYDFFNFTHKTGPYYKCDQCEELCRPLTSPTKSYYEDDEFEYEWYQEWLEELIQELTNKCKSLGLPEPDGLYVEGSNLNWRGQGGYTTCDLGGESLARTMSVNSNYCISNGVCFGGQGVATPFMTCTLHHHDVPMGGSLMVSPFWHDDIGHDFIVGDEALNETWSEISNIILRGYDQVFPSPASVTFHRMSKDSFSDAFDTLLCNGGWDDNSAIAVLGGVVIQHPSKAAAEALRKVIDNQLRLDELEEQYG